MTVRIHCDSQEYDLKATLHKNKITNSSFQLIADIHLPPTVLGCGSKQYRQESFTFKLPSDKLALWNRLNNYCKGIEI